MRIGIDVNGVLRDTIGKFKQTYEKFLIEKSEVFENDEFEYKITEPIDSLTLTNHFTFKDEEEYLSFMFEEFPMQIFGHAGSTELSTFHDLQDFYLENRDKHEITIFSQEKGKTKPATLFFLSKFGCEVESVKFYNQTTVDRLWEDYDLILTSDPELLSKVTIFTILIKYNTEYNKNSKITWNVDTFKEFNELIKKEIK
jgi:hypothetical protein